MTSIVTFVGVGLSAFVPAKAFEIVLNLAALGIISAWAVIVECHVKFWLLSRTGQ